MDYKRLFAGLILLAISLSLAAYSYGVTAIYRSSEVATLSFFTSCDEMPIQSIEYVFMPPEYDESGAIYVQFKKSAQGCKTIDDAEETYAEITASFPITLREEAPNINSLRHDESDGFYRIRVNEDLSNAYVNIIHDERLISSGLGEMRYTLEVEALNILASKAPTPIQLTIWLWNVSESADIEFTPPPANLVSHEGERRGYAFNIEHETIEGLLDRYALVVTNEELYRIKDLIIFMMGALAGQAISLISGSFRR